MFGDGVFLEEGQSLQETSMAPRLLSSSSCGLQRKPDPINAYKAHKSRRCEDKISAFTLPEALWLGFIFNIPFPHDIHVIVSNRMNQFYRVQQTLTTVSSVTVHDQMLFLKDDTDKYKFHLN